MVKLNENRGENSLAFVSTRAISGSQPKCRPIRVSNKGWKSGCPTDNHILKMWLSARFSGCPYAFAQGGS